ncbi:MAG: hypothetical protein OYL97_21015 [Candidatus Poribacteria bacterium]|nr:hypothetical protein [Candidatus Poribacteria bacterium]
MTMITVQWQRCLKNSLWCQFNEKLLSNGRFETRLGDHSVNISGIYIIWTGIDNRTVLKVGSGIIKDKLEEHLRDPEIQAYKPTRLYATWASTLSVIGAEEIQKGVEKFLDIVFKPKLVEHLPDVDLVMVNLPRWNKPVPPL